MASYEEALEAIDYLVGSDFGEEMEMLAEFTPKHLRKRERELIRVLGDVYKIAHSHVPTFSCHHVHTDWRQFTDDILATMRQEKDGVDMLKETK